MKNTLTQQLEKALQEVQYYKGKYEAINEELEEVKRNLEHKFNRGLDLMRSQQEELFSANKQLMEVVRWHINPETAKTPSISPRFDEFGNRRL